MKINGIQLFDQTQRDQPDFMAASCWGLVLSDAAPPPFSLCLYFYILWFRAVFTHGGWAAGLDRNRVWYHIHHTHHTGAALLLKKENSIKNTRNHGKIKYEMWQNSSEKMKIGRSWYLSSIKKKGEDRHWPPSLSARAAAVPICSDISDHLILKIDASIFTRQSNQVLSND